MGRYDRERMNPIAGDAKIGVVDLLQLGKDDKANVAKRYRSLAKDDIKIRIRQEAVYCSSGNHQITDSLGSAGSRQDLAKSEIISRRVYSKVAQDLTNVRKFVCWQTNKDRIAPRYPAYGFCYIDYSPSRAKPMERVARVSNSSEQIEQIYADSITREIKKGWNPVEA
jgi:hypothetical protein